MSDDEKWEESVNDDSVNDEESIDEMDEDFVQETKGGDF